MWFLMINTDLMTYNQSVGRETFLKRCSSQEETLYQMLKDYLPMFPLHYSLSNFILLSLADTKAEIKKP